jgi:hypothetical protein
MTMDQLTAVFGWMTVINVGLYTLTAAAVFLGGQVVPRLQKAVTGIPEADWPSHYIAYLSRYKIAIFIFNLTPFLALRIVA